MLLAGGEEYLFALVFVLLLILLEAIEVCKRRFIGTFPYGWLRIGGNRHIALIGLLKPDIGWSLISVLQTCVPIRRYMAMAGFLTKIWLRASAQQVRACQGSTQLILGFVTFPDQKLIS